MTAVYFNGCIVTTWFVCTYILELEWKCCNWVNLKTTSLILSLDKTFKTLDRDTASLLEAKKSANKGFILLWQKLKNYFYHQLWEKICHLNSHRNVYLSPFVEAERKYKWQHFSQLHMRTFCHFMFCHYKKKSLHVYQNQSMAKPKLFDWLEIMSYPEINPEKHPELLYKDPNIYNFT